MQGQDGQEVGAETSEDWHEDYAPVLELRGKGLPAPLGLLCGAILILGLGWTMFESIGGAPADALATDSTLTESGAEDTETLSNISMGEAELEAAAAALEDASAAVADASVAEPAVAVLSCRVQSMPVEAWRCIYPANQYDSGGYLKVSDNGEVTRYGPTEVMNFLGGSSARVALGDAYSIEAQANGDSNYTLRLEIQRGGGVIFQDEGSEYDTLRASE